ncbi:hypothetical protein CKA32_007129 [Geitlerinema sp. FC II]|nr:hypothetical protein CKA32_007129 [Geitlerinema sp. FC II]
MYIIKQVINVKIIVICRCRLVSNFRLWLAFIGRIFIKDVVIP